MAWSLTRPCVMSFPRQFTKAIPSSRHSLWRLNSMPRHRNVVLANLMMVRFWSSGTLACPSTVAMGSHQSEHTKSENSRYILSLSLIPEQFTSFSKAPNPFVLHHRRWHSIRHHFNAVITRRIKRQNTPIVPRPSIFTC